MPRAHPLLRILAHGVHASRFRSYDGNAAHSLLHHHSFTRQVAIIMLAKLRTLVGVFRLGERRAARRGASMQRWQDGAAASGWRGTAGRWRPKDTRTPFCACRPPKWALGARPAVKMDRERHMVPHARVRSMVACMRMRDAMLGWCFHIWSAVSRASKSGSKCCLYVFGTIENEIRRGPVMAALTSGPRARSQPPRHGRASSY